MRRLGTIPPLFGFSVASAHSSGCSYREMQLLSIAIVSKGVFFSSRLMFCSSSSSPATRSCDLLRYVIVLQPQTIDEIKCDVDLEIILCLFQIFGSDKCT